MDMITNYLDANKLRRKDANKLSALHLDKCTDKTKITRKSSKMGKHGHGNQKSTKEAKDSKLKPRKVNYGQASVKESQTLVNRSQPLEDKNPNVSI
ncbi:hypothetical protein Tco_1148298 [Tanacetum coccineum]